MKSRMSKPPKSFGMPRTAGVTSTVSYIVAAMACRVSHTGTGLVALRNHRLDWSGLTHGRMVSSITNWLDLGLRRCRSRRPRRHVGDDHLWLLPVGLRIYIGRFGGTVGCLLRTQVVQLLLQVVNCAPPDL